MHYIVVSRFSEVMTVKSDSRCSQMSLNGKPSWLRTTVSEVMVVGGHTLPGIAKPAHSISMAPDIQSADNAHALLKTSDDMLLDPG